MIEFFERSVNNERSRTKRRVYRDEDESDVDDVDDGEMRSKKKRKLLSIDDRNYFHNDDEGDYNDLDDSTVRRKAISGINAVSKQVLKSFKDWVI